MDKPVIAVKEPKILQLALGTYYWCVCGRSANQPFCDGSHEGTGFKPHEFEILEEQTVALCQCKHTGNMPFCDGSHAEL